MAHYLELDAARLREDPLILIVPGLHGGHQRHWQSLWASQCSDCRRVDLGTSDSPFRNNWVNRLNLAIYQTGRPVVLVAHGLGCLAVAWWAEYEQPLYGNPVVGALLAAPSDVDRPSADPRFARFAPCPQGPMPFPSILAASHNDPFCSLGAAQLLALDWGSRFASAGVVGHIDGESGLGDWHFGKTLLAELLREHRLEQAMESASRGPRVPAMHNANYVETRLAPHWGRRTPARLPSGKANLAVDIEPLVASDALEA